jgi:hypothetical protein
MNIAQSIIEDLKKNRQESKILSLQPIHDMENVLEQIEKVREELQEEFQEIGHSFWIYMNALQFQIMIGEMLLQHPLLQKHHIMLKTLESRYQPGTIISPITDSFFNLWKYFDAQIGKAQETLGTLTIAVAKFMSFADPLLEDLLERISISRMGIYAAEEDGKANSETLLHFREIITDRTIKAATTSEFPVNKGNILFIRVLPPIEKDDPEFIITTPYVIEDTDEEMWISFLKKKRICKGMVGSEEILNRFLKYGPRRNYWADYIMNADMGMFDCGETIMLSGLPP